MSENTMHLGRFVPSKEEIYIIGYNTTANQVLAVFPDYLRLEQRNALRDIIMSNTSQKEDYMAKILQSERFISDTTRVWLDVLYNDMFRKSSKAVRQIPLKDVDFANEIQSAFFRGYGEPINPENSKKAKASVSDTPPVDVDAIVAKISRSFEDRYGDILLRQSEQIATLTNSLNKLTVPVEAAKPVKAKTPRKPKKQTLAEDVKTPFAE